MPQPTDEYQTNVFDVIDEEGNQCEVQNSDCERYLGDLISTDAKNLKISWQENQKDKE